MERRRRGGEGTLDVSNTSAYSAHCTAQVLAAATEPDSHPYRWAFDQTLDRELVLDPSVGPTRG
ncbi:hypothetical protein ACWC4C_21520 [Streptomyces olivaceoviridis]